MNAVSRPGILVVGGGIGGLSAALALARRGLRARVLEKAPEFGEIGYGIQLGPNAYRMLDWLGVAKEIEQAAVFPDFLMLIDALTDREVTRISCGNAFRTRYGAPYMVVHRRDLHGALLEACRRYDGIALHTSKELVRFSDLGDRIVATCADGSEYEGAALIGADGLRSCVREALINDGPPRVAGHVTYRGVIPIDDVTDQTHFNDMVIWIGPDIHLVQYRLRSGTVMNNVATVVSRHFTPGMIDFGSPDELCEAFAQATPQVRDMLDYVGKDKNWILHDRDPVPGWTRGRATLLGDAAHPTLQYLAQGACMAIEDAVVLAALLSQAGTDINDALVAYENQRYLRTARVQITARIFGEIIHCGRGARDLRNHLLAQRTPETFWEVDWLYRGIEI